MMQIGNFYPVSQTELANPNRTDKAIVFIILNFNLSDRMHKDEDYIDKKTTTSCEIVIANLQIKIATKSCKLMVLVYRI